MQEREGASSASEYASPLVQAVLWVGRLRRREAQLVSQGRVSVAARQGNSPWRNGEWYDKAHS